jgi:predicted nucleic acid-binding protein
VTRWVIVDTGPLVAFLDRRQEHHHWIVELSKELAGPWSTCEPVLTEAWHLLRRLSRAQDALLDMIETGRIEVSFSLDRQIREVRALRQTYRDVPMSLADACLVRMAELSARHHVCTLDTDFIVYRMHQRQPIPVLMPPL